ncbi:hypothetical protein AGMMS49992_28040 [Clostridia bacterium]|nr:hypothetical protein AGMMS49992_28040 [Clostridia bacterium]
MIFSSNIFIMLFLPITLAGYYLLDKRFKNWFLLLMSLGFYAFGEPKFVFVMIFSIVFNYLMALLIDLCKKRQQNLYKYITRTLLILAVAGNLALLFVYKYLDFTINTINIFRSANPIALRGFVLPIGISFFTFQAMSYVIDVYRDTAPVQRKPQNVALFVSFFPQLIAGPIVRYSTIADEIINRRETFDDFSEGVVRFIQGFAKKIILANNMSLIVEKAFALPDAQRSIVYAWIGAIAYSFQILFDFSGYSDMAIGLGKMFGFGVWSVSGCNLDPIPAARIAALCTL